MIKPVYSEAKDLAHLFFPLSSAFLQLIHAYHVVPSEITPQQMKILTELNIAGYMRLSALSQRVAVTHGTMTVAVQKLHIKGYLKKDTDPSDERAIRLALTPKGKKVVAQIDRKMMELFNLICSGLNPSERRKLVDSYRFLLSQYQRILKSKKTVAEYAI